MENVVRTWPGHKLALVFCLKPVHHSKRFSSEADWWGGNRRIGFTWKNSHYLEVVEVVVIVCVCVYVCVYVWDRLTHDFYPPESRKPTTTHEYMTSYICFIAKNESSDLNLVKVGLSGTVSCFRLPALCVMALYVPGVSLAHSTHTKSLKTNISPITRSLRCHDFIKLVRVGTVSTRLYKSKMADGRHLVKIEKLLYLSRGLRNFDEIFIKLVQAVHEILGQQHLSRQTDEQMGVNKNVMPLLALLGDKNIKIIHSPQPSSTSQDAWHKAQFCSLSYIHNQSHTKNIHIQKYKFLSLHKQNCIHF